MKRRQYRQNKGETLIKALRPKLMSAAHFLLHVTYVTRKPILLEIADTDTEVTYGCVVAFWGNAEKVSQIRSLMDSWEEKDDRPASASESPDSQSPQ